MAGVVTSSLRGGLTGPDGEPGLTWPTTGWPWSADDEAPAGLVVGNPFVAHAPWTNGESGAALAADRASGADAELLERMAEVPTAVWLLPEAHPAGEVGPYVSDIVAQANEEGRIPVFVVYGIPGRDCLGGHSAGGLAPGEYLPWVSEIDAAAGHRAVVVLEPDALAVGECGQADRLGLLAGAVGVLAGGPVTYVDAGHADWVDAEEMARRLDEVGVNRVRGFSLNVSGYGFEDAQRAYGDSIVARLGAGHYVVDTGRSGAGASGEWCNPAGRALGSLPGTTGPGDAMDARLWIKPPGESDGTCGGGPEAGTFWPQRAIELARAAGW